ncbi:MAG TPA: ATP F0F1 synthase subunit B [Xanthobacteraceae bacterium]
MLAQLSTAEFWVAVAFLIFIGILFKFGVHRLAIQALDARGARIKAELDEARQIREEARAVLAESERRRREADSEAMAIIAGARADAERIAAEAETKAEEFVARRTRLAESKIAQAEAQAVAEVRAAAAEAAVGAAEKILGDTVKGKLADDLIGQGIQGLRSKLN